MLWLRELWTLGMLLCGSAADIRRGSLSRRYLLLCGVGSLLLLFAGCGERGLGLLYGVLPGLLVLLGARLSGGCIGAADGGMLLLLGVLRGWRGCMEILLCALFSAGCAAILLIVWRHADRRSRLPFYPFLLGGYLLSVLAQRAGA